MIKKFKLPNENTRKIIKDLAEAFSIQAKYSNRLWLAMIVAAILVVFPRKNGPNVELAFSLGEVPRAAYVFIGFFILIIVTLAYFQAYAQTYRAARVLHEGISELDDTDARQFYDLLLIASFARVAPLVDVFLILIEKARLPYKHQIAAVFYVVLKLVANLVILGIPSTAVAFAYFAIYNCGPGECIALPGTRFVATVALILAVLGLAIICFAEIKQIFRTATLYWLGKLPR